MRPRRWTFEVAAEHPPDQLREAVFRAAATARVEAAKERKPFDRTAVMSEVAE